MHTIARALPAKNPTPFAPLARGCSNAAPPPAQAPLAAGRQISEMLGLLGQQLAPQRRVVHAGDVIYRVGERFVHLYILNSGLCKIVNLAADGREQLVSLNFRGDWLGFDGIADGHHGSDAIAMDTGEIWVIPYQSLMEASASCPAVLHAMHAAMSLALARDQGALMSICTLPAVARVADFLLCWAGSLAERGIRTDQITLRMTRAEIGNHLGMTLESVSRALSRLARDHVIGFATQGRRDVQIPDVSALSAFVQRHLSPVPVAMQ
ncbi:Crp/Fnr family transcriptional regulator [Hydrogenophaga sp. BPS33]|uniref:Crp/Fnr family transcriptional regulator n=1 Tax=Hydrogenophaga sp. BPS33 TaxID=2651974 RepID=UPI00131F59A5|nr:Crp/Fnr family transcriptional regulator [Hydrogenophaga sp. BPS33]QHE86146.1 Crp/Fnr family transcriptional regulator [Hydrogenophaga sp. BPS33]